jgi:aminoglycoside phosphotransferase (APT) family kinase protein
MVNGNEPEQSNEPDVKITSDLVSKLVDRQFSQWPGLPIMPVEPGGWDNRTFRLGQDLVVRLPSNAGYVAQVEQRWLPILGPMLPTPIPCPVAMGEPGNGYPWRWSVYRWLEGEPSSLGNIDGVDRFARDLAKFLHSTALMRRKDQRRENITFLEVLRSPGTTTRFAMPSLRWRTASTPQPQPLCGRRPSHRCGKGRVCGYMAMLHPPICSCATVD